jgi:hypothetical protein
MVSELSKWSSTNGSCWYARYGACEREFWPSRRLPAYSSYMVTVYCASSGQPGGRTCTHMGPATPVSLLTGSPRKLRMHRLIAALVVLIDSPRRCRQVCTGYGVVVRSLARRTCSQSGPGAWSTVGELASFALAGTTDGSTRVPRTAIPEKRYST